jgi:hypothetical protein
MRVFISDRLISPPCSALCIFFVMEKKSGVPWMTRHSARTPALFIRRLNELSISATPPP